MIDLQGQDRNTEVVLDVEDPRDAGRGRRRRTSPIGVLSLDVEEGIGV
jgi:hypothetical protein